MGNNDIYFQPQPDTSVQPMGPSQQATDQFERFQPRNTQDEDKMESAFVQKTVNRLRELDLDMNSLTPVIVKKLIAKYVS